MSRRGVSTKRVGQPRAGKSKASDPRMGWSPTGLMRLIRAWVGQIRAGRLRALSLVLLVAACGGQRDYAAPRELDNACRILEQRPAYLRAFRQTERRWGVPVSVQMAVIYQESKFIANARTPHQYALGVIPMGRQSSAYGYSQALDGTLDEYEAYRHTRARRDDISDATDFMGWYMVQTRNGLGIPLTDTENQYLAYHEGRTGYANGSHQEKAWLMEVASGLAERSSMYDAQLRSCRRG